eukprot:COSAG06_NODE_20633_length_787_cov_1.216570_1_plen_146_part_10
MATRTEIWSPAVGTPPRWWPQGGGRRRWTSVGWRLRRCSTHAQPLPRLVWRKTRTPLPSRVPIILCPEPVLANHRSICPEPVLANHRSKNQTGSFVLCLRYLHAGLSVPAPGNIYVTPLRLKLGGRPILSARLSVETAGFEPKRPE